MTLMGSKVKVQGQKLNFLKLLLLDPNFTGIIHGHTASKFKSQSSRSRSKVKSFKIILINSKLHTHDSSNILNIIDVTKGQRSKVRESKVKVKGHKSKVNFPILVPIRSKLQRSDFCNILLRFEVKGYVRYQKDFAKCTCLRVSTIFSSIIFSFLATFQMLITST